MRCSCAPARQSGTEAAAPTPASASAAEEEGTSEEVRGVYLVRIPFVEVDTTQLRLLEGELESLNKQVNILNAAIRVRRIERQSAYDKTNASRDKLRECSQRSRWKIEELAPYREKLKAQQERVRSMKNMGRDLQCKSEEELIAKIEELEYTIAHGNLTLNQEKDMVKRIKKLKTQKDSIIEYSLSKDAIAETKVEIDEFRDHLDILNNELDVLKSREKTHRDAFLKLKEEEEAIQGIMQELINERDDIKRAGDECYGRVKAERARCRGLISESMKFRKIKADVKRKLEEGDVGEASQLAASRVDAWFTDKWHTDTEYRAKYVENMSRHRFKKVSIEEIANELSQKRPASSKPKKPKPAPKESPEDLIASLLKQANEQWTESKRRKEIEARAPAAAPAAKEKGAVVGREAAEPPAKEAAPAPARVAAAAVAPVPVPAAAAASNKDDRRAKPVAKRAAKAPVVDETVVAGFELPSVVREAMATNKAAVASYAMQQYNGGGGYPQEKKPKRTRKGRQGGKKDANKQEKESIAAAPKDASKDQGAVASSEPAPTTTTTTPTTALAGKKSPAGPTQPSASDKKQQLKRVKRRGKVVILKADKVAKKKRNKGGAGVLGVMLGQNGSKGGEGGMLRFALPMLLALFGAICAALALRYQASRSAEEGAEA